jgi:hypothetical protein
MVKYVANSLEAFPGPANQTRCFAHILNLVAKCIMKQFDTPKQKPDRRCKDNDDNIGATELALQALTDEIEEIREENDSDEEEGETGEENDELVDGREGMTDEEILELDEKVRPVHLVLVEVC